MTSLCLFNTPMCLVSSQCGESAAALQSAAEQQDVPADLHPHAGGSEVVLHEGPRERRLPAHGGSAGICRTIMLVTPADDHVVVNIHKWLFLFGH